MSAHAFLTVLDAGRVDLGGPGGDTIEATEGLGTVLLLQLGDQWRHCHAAGKFTCGAGPLHPGPGFLERFSTVLIETGDQPRANRVSGFALAAADSVVGRRPSTVIHAAVGLPEPADLLICLFVL